MSSSFTSDLAVSTTSRSWTGATNLSASNESVDGTLARTNLFTNPSFETDLTGWNPSAATTATRDTTTSAYSGNASAKLVAKGGGRNYVNAEYTLIDGATYTISSFVELPADTATPYGFVVEFYDDFTNYTYMGEVDSDVSVQTATDWTRLFMTFTMPQGATGALIYPIISAGVAPAGETVYVDSILLETGSTLGDYFDGNTAPTVATAAVAPRLVTQWNASATTRHIVHDVLGSQWPDVTVQPAGPRSGTMAAILDDEDDAALLFAMLTGTDVITFSESTATIPTMRLLANGQVTIQQDDQDRTVWAVTFSYMEVQ